MPTHWIRPDHSCLTTEHSASSHGVPVLVIAGEPYGAADRLPAKWRGLVGAEAVVLWAMLPERTPAERSAARAYCAQWPVGPQVPPEPAQALGGSGGRASGDARRGDSEAMRALARKRWRKG